VPFDTVEIDTAGLADLSANAYGIFLNQTGYWWIGGYGRISGFLPGGSNSDIFASAQATGGVFLDPRHDNSSLSIGTGETGPLLVSTLTTPVQVALKVGFNGASTTSLTNVLQAELWALKVRDL
jgi:hypothetical protein